jgi:hypothetical protein
MECIARLVGILVVLLFVFVWHSVTAWAQSPAEVIPAQILEVAAAFLRFPATPAEWGFVASGFAGMVGHWYKRKRRKQSAATFIDHFFANYPGSTLATVFVFWFAAMYVLENVPIADAHPGGAIAVGLAIGWMLDSWINKGDAPREPVIAR